MINFIIEIVGWIGMLLILSAYFLITKGKLNIKSRNYHLLNLVGAIGIIVNSLWNSAYPPAGLNIVWAVIAVWGIWNSVR